MAEQVFRLVGFGDDDALLVNSYSVIQGVLKEAGVEGEFSIKNGSGLYDGNTLSPKQIVTLLTFMADHSFGPEFATTLAIAGTDGTLKKRLGKDDTRARLRGKTGTLNEVSALSGYMTTRSDIESVEKMYLGRAYRTWARCV